MDDASLRIRPSTPSGIIGDYEAQAWEESGVTEGLERWFLGMTEDTFRQGCVTEKFTYVFCLYFVTGAGEKRLPDNWIQAILNTTKWLEVEMYVHSSSSMSKLLIHILSYRCQVEPDLLEHRRKSFT